MSVPPLDPPRRTLLPPPGRPSWRGTEELPLLYLGWGGRDFERSPVPLHRDLGSNYYLLLQGEVAIKTTDGCRRVRGPAALLFDADCAFGLEQSSGAVEVLVWVWAGAPIAPGLRPPSGGWLQLPLAHERIASLQNLHLRCRDEVASVDASACRALLALRELVEVELLRAAGSAPTEGKTRLKRAQAWMSANLAVQSPVPALCDYLRMSPATLHRFFVAETGRPPGAYFRELRLREALRLIATERRRVKEVAFRLGYRHASDLSRALAVYRRRAVLRSG